MNNLSSSMNNSEENKLQNLLSWRRFKTLEYLSKGWTQDQIANVLRVSQSTTHRDIVWLIKQCNENLKFYVEERIPLEVEQQHIGLKMVLKLAFEFANLESAKLSERISALNVILSTYDKISDILSGEPIIKKVVNDFKVRRELLEAKANEIQIEKVKVSEVE